MSRIEELRRRIAKAERRLARGVNRRVQKSGVVYEAEIRDRLVRDLARLGVQYQSQRRNGKEAA